MDLCSIVLHLFPVITHFSYHMTYCPSVPTKFHELCHFPAFPSHCLLCHSATHWARDYLFDSICGSNHSFSQNLQFKILSVSLFLSYVSLQLFSELKSEKEVGMQKNWWVPDDPHPLFHQETNLIVLVSANFCKASESEMHQCICVTLPFCLL